MEGEGEGQEEEPGPRWAWSEERGGVSVLPPRPPPAAQWRQSLDTLPEHLVACGWREKVAKMPGWEYMQTKSNVLFKIYSGSSLLFLISFQYRMKG